ncbi:hypothetical protein [Caldilinea sp.]|uniref:hypothetical protein n=1 Tax=Caldilinea sp. TaxID=2293560 RepID=UPI002BDFA388|nr:hypothetical protein [Caldilinea sp.]
MGCTRKLSSPLPNTPLLVTARAEDASQVQLTYVIDFGDAVTVEMTDAAADHIAAVGYDPSYGARPLRRLLQRQVENELSKRLLKGEYKTGDHVVVDYDAEATNDSKLVFRLVEQAPIAVDLPLNAEHA